MPEHPTREQLEAGWETIRQAPRQQGVLEMIVIRPRDNEREELSEGVLDRERGLVGDNWSTRDCRLSADGGPHPDMQLNITNARAMALVAGRRDRWKLAGDQLYVDLDLSEDNVPPGTRLRLGEAVVEITAQPHNGCRKFRDRFGEEALRFVNSPEGKRRHLRGVNARVVVPGPIRVGDAVVKLGPGEE